MKENKKSKLISSLDHYSSLLYILKNDGEYLFSEEDVKKLEI